MLFSILRNASLSGGEKLLYLLVIVFCVLLSLSVHELAHGLSAYWLGDRTAKYSGRLSLNPLHHMDPIGALCLFFFGFGWAKPVPVNPWNFKNKKLGMVLTSLAGPISNFLLAFLAQLILTILLQTPSVAIIGTLSFQIASVSSILLQYLVVINLGLGLFNLIPIPPLDGSKILGAILPQRIYFKLMEYERYSFFLLLLLINLPNFNSLLYLAEDGIISLFNMIIGLFL